MARITGEDAAVFKKATCRNCAAQLEYTLDEVKQRHGKDYSGGSDGEEWIGCPRCGKKVILRSW